MSLVGTSLLGMSLLGMTLLGTSLLGSPVQRYASARPRLGLEGGMRRDSVRWDAGGRGGAWGLVQAGAKGK